MLLLNLPQRVSEPIQYRLAEGKRMTASGARSIAFERGLPVQQGSFRKAAPVLGANRMPARPHQRPERSHRQTSQFYHSLRPLRAWSGCLNRTPLAASRIYGSSARKPSNGVFRPK